jgi:hypothetical protein
MVDDDRLLRRAQRAYELGRLKMAVRVAAFIAPMVALCALRTGATESCVCLGFLLLGVAVFLRWRTRQGVESVSTGLVAGVVPLFVGLIILEVAPSCAGQPLVSWCTAIAIGVGLPSGAWIGLRAMRREVHVSWLTALGIAVIAASLGCVGLGVAGIVGVVAGLLVGGAAGRTFAPAR